MTADRMTAVEAIRNGVRNFVEDMRAQGIHVGIGDPATCCLDGEPWPCQHERSIHDR